MSDPASEWFGDGSRATEPPDELSPLARVLYVDDEPCALSAIARTLQGRVKLATSQSPAEALSLLERDGDVAVVIADLSMPGMDGLEFLEAVKSMSPTTTRLVLTGTLAYGPPPSADTVFKFLSKLCPPELLRESVAEAVEYHRLLASSPMQPVEGPPAIASLPAASEQRPRRESDAAAGMPPIHAGDLASPGADRETHGARPLPVPAPATRFGLSVPGRIVELLPGSTIVGRSRTCNVPLSDPRVSRRQVSFEHDGDQLRVKNLSGVNRVLINGRPVEDAEPRTLRVGDRLHVGSQQIEVCAMRDYTPSFEPAERSLLVPPRKDEREPAPTPATLATVAAVARKYLRLGQSREAERVLRPLLHGLMQHCRSGQVPLASDVQLAARLALDISEANRSPEWINYLFDFHAALERPADHDVTERLYRLIPEIAGISLARYRGYLATLARKRNQLAPADRFLVRRIEGLQTSLMMSAHL